MQKYVLFNIDVTKDRSLSDPNVNEIHYTIFESDDLDQHQKLALVYEVKDRETFNRKVLSGFQFDYIPTKKDRCLNEGYYDDFIHLFAYSDSGGFDVVSLGTFHDHECLALVPRPKARDEQGRFILRSVPYPHCSKAASQYSFENIVEGFVKEAYAVPGLTDEQSLDVFTSVNKAVREKFGIVFSPED